MWRLLQTFLMAGSLLAGALVNPGCDTTHHGVDSILNESPQIQRVTPSDGATGVDVAETVCLKFSLPMDTLSVMSAMHLSFGSSMHEWMDTLSHRETMGGMGMADMDSMMSWMDSIHSAGSLHWNAAMDSCEFIPAAPLAPGAEHMLLLFGPVRSRSGGMMDMSHMSNRTYMTHFTTAP